MGYGFAFNDHLQALTAAAKAKMGVKEPAPRPEEPKPAEAASSRS